ncbi:MAG: hypothetical protein ACYC9J_11875 [Sulfuricaulis sp.]
MRWTRVTPRSRLASYFLAVLLIAVECGALAHELHHHGPNPDTHCAQCLYAKHLSKTPATVCCVPVVSAPDAHSLPISLPAPQRHETTGYAARAPPADSEI